MQIDPLKLLAAAVSILLLQSCEVKNIPIKFTPKLIFVSGGTFERGDGQNYPKEPATVRNFYIGQYEVTQKEWINVMGSMPRQSVKCDSCPVGKVKMSQVQAFFKKLNRSTGKNYRLPTQDEWEYAAKGGDRSHHYQYSGSDDEEMVGWVPAVTGMMHPVGLKRPNELRIYDMTGNVREWTSSPYQDAENIFFIRGGSFKNGWHMSTNTWRDWLGGNYTDVDIGFRYAMDTNTSTY